MLSKWPKVVCDPVHNLIPFEDSACDRLLLSLINTKEFQRLRRIKQLGMSEMVFPGANHSRFAHSIGVMHMARVILDRLDRVCKKRIEPEQRLVVLTAALLHDLGHGPFSHAFEKITGQNHEQRTEEIIREPETEVHQCLIRHDVDLPKKLLVFFDSEVEDSEREAVGIPTFLTQIVSSQLDADRFDYLLRDSYASGTSTGQFEHAYLIQNLYLDETYGRFFVGRKAYLAAEAYVFARYRMYQTVYFHKTTRAAEVMLKLAFQRVKQKIKDVGVAEVKKTLVLDAPPTLYKAFSGDMLLEDYLALDDSTVSEFLKCAARSPDDTLKDLATGILNRRLYKAIDVSDYDPHVFRDFEKKVRATLPDQDSSLEYSFVQDTAADTPYKPYDPSSGKAPTEIYVETANGVQEIGKLSAPVESLKKKYTLLRYYYSASVHDAMQEIIRNTLKKENP